MAKTLTDKQMEAKRENDREYERKPSGYVLKQRAFLKCYMITLTEQERMYGNTIVGLLREEFSVLGYKPTPSEIYKSLHELIKQEILEPMEKIREDSERRKVIYYRIKDQERAESYKKRVYEDMVRSYRILKKGLEDNFKWKG